MSTERGVVTMYKRPAAPTREPLPIDLLLEIVARSDVTSIIRCARTSKFLRAAILDPAFRRRLALQAAADFGGFDPALLFGVSYMSYGHLQISAHNIIHTPSPSKIHPRARLPACCILRDSFEAVASRDCLLLLRRRYGASPHPNIELRVCDTITGHMTFLPNVTACYAHAFLSVSDAGASYELIVTDNKDLQFQTFSSQHGQWTAVREPSVTGRPHCLDASSRVIGRTVYWLCRLNDPGDCWDGILALDVEAAEVTTLDLPPGCLSRMMSCTHLLLASLRGRLSLLVAETCGLSMWMWTPAATWSRQLVIGAEDIVRPVGLVSSPLSFALEGFGERSGAVIVQVDGRDLLRLDLGTKAVTRLHNPGRQTSVACLFLHETDRASLLKKSF